MKKTELVVDFKVRKSVFCMMYPVWFVQSLIGARYWIPVCLIKISNPRARQCL